MRARPLCVGVLHDFPRPDGGAAFEQALRLGIDEVEATGRLPAPVTFAHERAHPPDHDVPSAFARLARQGVVAMLGPALTDGALVVGALADAAHLPCINYAGNERARSAYLFHFQLGSLEDEPALLVGDLARRGLGRFALLRDTSPVGERMAGFVEDAAATAGCEIATHLPVEPDGAGGAAAVDTARRARPDALLFVGFWRAAHAVALAMRARGWRLPARANSALMYGHADPAWARDWDGWTYADTVSETNPRLAALAAAGLPTGPGEAAAYDMGRLLAEGIARAPDLTGPGIRAGLERVKALPAATGHAGTVMGFGHCDRGALKGPYLVLRTWRDGRSVPQAEPA